MVEQELGERTRQTIETYCHCLENPSGRKAIEAIFKNPSFQATLARQGIDVEAVKKALLSPLQTTEK
jgi:hypothetical protein